MDLWKTHVHLEILDAIPDKVRLLEITSHLQEMERADLIPDDTAQFLFNSIDIANNQGAIK
jgi:hypothetical protein